MDRVISVFEESFPIAGGFTISRGSKTQADVIVLSVEQDGVIGRGECVPYGRYGETMESVRRDLEAISGQFGDVASRDDVLRLMKPGAARNALDCALWDIESRIGNYRVTEKIGSVAPKPLQTAYTLSLATPEIMAAQAGENAWRPLLKVKIGGQNDAARIRAVRDAAPESRLILDANEGWAEENVQENLALAAELGVALVEQPLPAGHDRILGRIRRPLPVCADESVHTADDLAKLEGLYDAVNIKLDKAGGLTAALELRDRARASGFSIMVGCMVGTSLAMAPAVLLAQDAEYVDLDGPLLLARDRTPGLVYEGSLVYPPERGLWG